MNTNPPSYDTLHFDTPSLDEVRGRYEALLEELEAAGSHTQQIDVIRRWDELRRELDSWSSWVGLRYAQNTTDEARKQEQAESDEITSRLAEIDGRLKRRLLQSPHREELEADLGRQAFALWEADANSVDKSIEEDLIREKELVRRYTELLAGAAVEFQGREHTLTEMNRYRTDPDRQIRHDAAQASWGWFEEHAEAFDDIFDELTVLRDQMAKKLGDEDFVALGYRRMQRVDYTEEDVARFRDEVRRVVVPLAGELRRRQAEALGLEKVRFWDEEVLDPAGAASPDGDRAWMEEQASRMFASLHPELSQFYELMRGRGYLDLDDRKGKSGGGFCTAFPTVGMPFVFANFNGTKHDARVFTHEMGHAFQCWKSADMPLADYLWPTMESAEIHSMSLEFLSAPLMELFFGDQADRFRRQHLIEALLFLPYGVAVDHFQHLVYREPGCGPKRRLEMWQEMERLYLPERDYGDIPRVTEGGLWQRQRHIYMGPFYYIDYCLAQTCALQFWRRARTEGQEQAMEDYVALCAQGGRAPFSGLAAFAKLRSPFEPGSLEAVVEDARGELL